MFSSRTGAIVDDEETEEELRKSRETIDDFGFMRADGAAPPPRLLAPSVPQPIAAVSEEDDDDGEPAMDVSDEEMEDDENEDEGEEEEEEEPQAKEEVKEEDIAMGPPKKLKRLSILKRVASGRGETTKAPSRPVAATHAIGEKLGFK